ncbi:MAG TPA: type 4a pilus biogenesis protein PilO [Pyrinomonadaceae bacterium]|nr:type 4a pilus biogenesis protein PilO [Pyrinomonadaceae bacterium]
MESLQRKPWYVQLALLGTVALAVYGGFYYFVTKGVRAEAAETQGKVAALQQTNARAQIASQRLNEFKVAFQRAQADYDDLKALLPEQRELTAVLQGVQDRARGQLAVLSFKPKEDVQQDFYSGKSIEIEVSGGYNNVGAFFAQMAAYQRIVSITDFKLSKVADKTEKESGGATNRTVDARFLLTAYYVSPDKIDPTVVPEPAKDPKAKPGQPGAQPAAPAAAQPAAPPANVSAAPAQAK